MNESYGDVPSSADQKVKSVDGLIQNGPQRCIGRFSPIGSCSRSKNQRFPHERDPAPRRQFPRGQSGRTGILRPWPKGKVDSTVLWSPLGSRRARRFGRRHDSDSSRPRASSSMSTIASRKALASDLNSRTKSARLFQCAQLRSRSRGRIRDWRRPIPRNDLATARPCSTGSSLCTFPRMRQWFGLDDKVPEEGLVAERSIALPT